MKRNWLLGVGVGVLVTAALLAVGIGAFNAGQAHQRTVEVVTSGGEPGNGTLVVPVDSWRGGYGGWHGGPWFLLFPLIVVGVILLVSSGRRRGWGGPGPYRRAGYGPYGPCGPDDDAALADWHRRAHAEPSPTATPSTPAPPPPPGPDVGP